jgi:3-phosphoshikimate 1-carboxyvinyltransferase
MSLSNQFSQAQVTELPDGLTVRGGTPLEGCSCQANGDHRIAMSACVAALLARGTTRIQGAECINVSYPGFQDVLKSLQVE